MAAADRKAVLAAILKTQARCTPVQMNAMIGGLGLALGGIGMTETHRDSVIAAILRATDSQDKTYEMVLGLSLALGGTEMTGAHRNAMITAIVQTHATQTPERTGEMIRGFSFGLGGSVMSSEHRDAVFAAILNAPQTCRPVHLKWMMRGLSFALGCRAMTDAHRDALLAAIVRTPTTCTPLHMGWLIWGLGCELGGAEMTDAHRNALLTAIRQAYTPSEMNWIRSTAYGLGLALGGAAMPDAHRDALLAAIIQSPVTYIPKQIEGMIYGFGLALGGASMTDAHRDALLAAIIRIPTACTDVQIGAMVRGLGLALGGAALTDAHRDALLTAIFRTPTAHTGAQMGLMVQGLSAALGSAEMTDAHRGAVLAAILGNQARLTPQQMGVLIFSFSETLVTAAHRDALLGAILRAPCNQDKIGRMIMGLMPNHGNPLVYRSVFYAKIVEACSPLQPHQRGMLIAAALGGATSRMNSQDRQIMRAGLDTALNSGLEALGDDERAELQRFINMGLRVGCGDLTAAFVSQDLTDQQRIQYVGLSYRTLHPLDQPQTLAQLSEIQNLDIPLQRKATLLSSVLEHGQVSPIMFRNTRAWLVGQLDWSDAPLAPQNPETRQISPYDDWGISENPELLEARQVAAFAQDLGASRTMLYSLYQAYRNKMTAGFIEEERRIIARAQNLPDPVKTTILATLVAPIPA